MPDLLQNLQTNRKLSQENILRSVLLIPCVILYPSKENAMASLWRFRCISTDHDNGRILHPPFLKITLGLGKAPVTNLPNVRLLLNSLGEL